MDKRDKAAIAYLNEALLFHLEQARERTTMRARHEFEQTLFMLRQADTWTPADLLKILNALN